MRLDTFIVIGNYVAQRRIVEIVDDLDGTTIEDGGGTQSFSLNGTTYEIELSTANLEKLRVALAPFIEAGRRVSSPRRKRRRARDLDAIREWARANGFEVSDRGRVAAGIVAAYESR